ncbi:MAG: tRNA (cytidine(34)-2'-O)-methyltransferase [Nitrospina sp.]|jgi:tRNA (cytidine/uridine-2'-O-)-methyltransferase|nr:tRNA (cytidine(34)-2'-O)-methyltransferase [Nitrospina sp.]MBT6600246.1 tRNA (cytidine(34)-2'-O)-methyltransferase [Nitrospina sp.]
MPHDFSIVLVTPEIPTNTGSIGRLCLATNSTLHLIDPLGFDISDSRVKRAGLDYWKHLDVKRHKSFEVFLDSLPTGAPTVFFSKKSKNSLYEKKFEQGSYLIFGCETKGLGDELIEKFSKDTFNIPQYDDRVRSLNLANAASIVVYEAIRQLGY